MSRAKVDDRTAPHPMLVRAREVLELEAQGILHVQARLGMGFVRAVELMAPGAGRVIVCGIGKSGIIGRKISATLNSTGTPSFFLHPVEAAHGDLGQAGARDIVLALSNSGETGELNALLPSLKAIGCRIIALTGNPASTLGRQSDLVIDVGVVGEACPLGVAPTASSTAMLAVGDALAVVLAEQKRFSLKDFKRIHPGGLLGKRLAGRVRDLLREGAAVPSIGTGASMEAAVREIDRGRLGAAVVVDARGRLAGIVTDGDVRRMLVRHPGKRPDEIRAAEVMSRRPRRVRPDTPAYDALNLMEQHQITVLPVVDAARRVTGMLHLHDILGKGEFKFLGGPPAD